jgi:hypothetical protein
LLEKLGEGEAIISDEREGLNLRNGFVEALSHTVSELIAPCVQDELDRLRHLLHATTSGRTSEMIDHLLRHMSEVAIHDLGITAGSDEERVAVAAETGLPDALRFSTPFYYRRPGHSFQVTLLVDPARIPADAVLKFSYILPEGMRIEPALTELPVGELGSGHSLTWTVTGERSGERGELTVTAGPYLALCEVVVSDQASSHHHHVAGATRDARQRSEHDHGVILFSGYDFRALDNEVARAVYSPEERKVIINTTAPTVQMYVDGRGRFRDSARMLLAELFLDVIADELSRRMLARSARPWSEEAHQVAKREIIHRYGSDIHRSFLTT